MTVQTYEAVKLLGMFLNVTSFFFFKTNFSALLGNGHTSFELQTFTQH